MRKMILTNDERRLIKYIPYKILYARYERYKDMATTCYHCGEETMVGDDATLLYTCHTCGTVRNNSCDIGGGEIPTRNIYEIYDELLEVLKTLKWDYELPQKILELFCIKGEIVRDKLLDASNQKKPEGQDQ